MLRRARTSVFKNDMETLIVAATSIRRFSQAEWRACLVASGFKAASGTLSLIFGWRAKSPFSPEDADPIGLLRYTCCYISYILLSVILSGEPTPHPFVCITAGEGPV